MGLWAYQETGSQIQSPLQLDQCIQSAGVEGTSELGALLFAGEVLECAQLGMDPISIVQTGAELVAVGVGAYLVELGDDDTEVREHARKNVAGDQKEEGQDREEDEGREQLARKVDDGAEVVSRELSLGLVRSQSGDDILGRVHGVVLIGWFVVVWFLCCLQCV